MFVFDVPVGKNTCIAALLENNKTKQSTALIILLHKPSEELSDSERETLCFHAVILALHANRAQSDPVRYVYKSHVTGTRNQGIKPL